MVARRQAKMWYAAKVTDTRIELHKVKGAKVPCRGVYCVYELHDTRRQKLKSKLEAKLSELRQILGPDNRPDIERVAHMLLKQEESLRSKQNALVLEVKDVINDFKADLQAIKERLAKPSNSLSSLQKPRPRPVSEASSTGSGRTLTLAM